MAVPGIEFGQMKKSAMQMSLHVPVGDGEKIGSNFFYPFGKVSYSTPQAERFKQGAVSDSRADFIYEGTGTFIESTYMIQRFPLLKVKKSLRNKIRIRFTHNLIINTIKEITGSANGVHFFTLSKVYLDFWLQFFCKPEFKKETLEKVGNIPQNEEWSDCIYPFEASFDIPTPYSLDQALSFPVLLVDSFVISIGRRHRLSELIQMQELRQNKDEKVWVDIPTKMSYLGMSNESMLPVQELWGEIGYNSDFEIEWLKCKESVNLWYTDVVTLRSTNPEKYGCNLPIQINLEYPIKAFLWAAENMSATANRNYSNYSTNSEDPCKGRNPIKSVSFEYTGGKKFENMASVHFDSIFPKRHFRSAAHEPGYNGFSVCQNPIAIAIDSGLVTSDTKPIFTAELGDNQDSSNYEEDDENDVLETDTVENDSKFILHICTMVLRKISFVKNEDGKGCKILLDSVEN
jgi:hypothetical protein